MLNREKNAGRTLWAAAASVLLSATAASAQTPPSQGYSIMQLGLSGTDYQYVTQGQIVRDQTAVSPAANGHVAGVSLRYSATGVALGRDAWTYTGTTTQRIGLTGQGYEYTTANGTFRSVDISRFAANAKGQVLGNTTRYNSGGAALGFDAWTYDGTSTHLIGLTSAQYNVAFAGPNGGVQRTNFGLAINSKGQVVGFTDRAAGGRDAWVYDGTTTNVVGLTGLGYEQPTASGTKRAVDQTMLSIGDGGAAAGRTYRLPAAAGDNTNLGADAWVYNGVATGLAGLTGSEYEYTVPAGTYRESVIGPVNASANAIGYTKRTNPSQADLGTDAWRFDNGTIRVGFTGTGYEYANPGGLGRYRFSRADFLSAANTAAGYSNRYSASGAALGADTWFNAGPNTFATGLTGGAYEYTAAAGTFRESRNTAVNPAGTVLGYANRYAAAGTQVGADAWVYTHGVGTRMVGLTGAAYERTVAGATYREGKGTAINAAGQTIGYTLRTTATGIDLGQDAWFDTGSATRLIGLTGDAYDYPVSGGVYRFSSAERLNDAGQAVGISLRYDNSGAGLGIATWFYDDDTDVTTPLEFSFQSGSNYSSTIPVVLTPKGVVLGYYELFNGSTDAGQRIFWWSQQAGFHDLGSLVPNLAASGWNTLAGLIDASNTVAPGGSPRYILGSGTVAGQSSDNSIFLLTANPATLPGDIDDDGDVDRADLTILLNNFGTTNAGGVAAGDLNGDGRISPDDLALWNVYFSQFVPGSIPVPEPAFAAAALLPLLWKRRRR